MAHIVPPSRRRPSMFAQEESYAAILKERMKDVSHKIIAIEPGINEEETDDELGKAESVTVKPSVIKLKYGNTYRMEPHKKFLIRLVETKSEQILKDRLSEIKYDHDLCRSMSISLADEILKAVKELGFDHYKYIVRVFIVENNGQGINISSRWLWDAERDNWASAVFKTLSLVSVAVIYAIYYD